MGMIRKTLSIGTFGTISFRSKKEQLRRADRSRQDAEQALEREHAGRLSAESRISAAESRVKRATDDAQRAAKRLEHSKRNDRRAKRVRTLIEDTEPARRHARETAGRTAREAKRGAARGAKRSLRRAKVAASSTKDAVAPQVDRLVSRASDAIDQLSS